jgi:hypothetical protein
MINSNNSLRIEIREFLRFDRLKTEHLIELLHINPLTAACTYRLCRLFSACLTEVTSRKDRWTSVFFCGLVVFLSITSCQNSFEEEATILQAVAHRDNLIGSMDSLKTLNDSIWVEVTQTLERDLPKDLPSDERRNMLQLKNADLLQMFQVFDSLDSSLQNKVLQAGKRDQDLALQMRAIMLDIEETNKIITSNLEMLEKKDSLRASQLKLRTKT